MSLGHGANIVQDGLVLVTDFDNPKSYSGSTDLWKDLITNTVSTGASTPSSLTNPAYLSGTPVSSLTVMCFVTLLGTSTEYANHPVNKWSSTNDATFVLYHFLDFDTPGSGFRLGWYANRGGVWGNITAIYQAQVNQTYHIVVQYNSTSGGQLWINGNKIGGRTASGVLANNNVPIRVDGGPQPRTNIHHTKYVLVYNKELTDNEVLQNFNALRGRYNI